jgi:hypothetical protein
MSTRTDLAGITTQIHDLLLGLEAHDRQKAITAAMTLLGDAYFPVVAARADGSVGGQNGAAQSNTADDSALTARAFFDQKEPRGKVEELVVAARYREIAEDAETHTKEQLGQTIKAARRNFDATNFARDLANAKTAKFLNLGKDNSLSYSGQKYVDALPDREQAAAVRKSTGAKRGRKARKNKA